MSAQSKTKKKKEIKKTDISKKVFYKNQPSFAEKFDTLFLKVLKKKEKVEQENVQPIPQSSCIDKPDPSQEVFEEMDSNSGGCKVARQSTKERFSI